MFVEEKRQGEVTETATLTDEQRALLKAADLIEEHGHVQGRYGNERVGFCILGALHMAVGIKSPDSVPDDPVVAAAVNKYLATAIKARADDWNDSHSKDEVVAKLRAVALMPRG